MSSYSNEPASESVIDQFFTSPTTASTDVEEKFLDFLLLKVQRDVLDSVDLLGLTDSSYEKLDEMIGVLGTLVETDEIAEQVCVFLYPSWSSCTDASFGQCYAIFRLALSSPFGDEYALKKYANRRLRKYDPFI